MFVIALDIGGTNVRAAIANAEGTLLEVVKESTLRHDKAIFISQIVNIIFKLNLNHYKPVAIGIGVPGTVRANGFINILPNIGISDIDLVTPLQKNFNLPVYIKNDAEMAAFAEDFAGVGKDAKSTYFVTISTGIGGCLVADNELKNVSREIGHTLIPYKNDFYELEKIASGDGVVKLAALNNCNYKNGKAFFADVRAKTPAALKIFADWLDIIVDFFAYINTSFCPAVIAVTGGVLKSKDLFWDELQTRLKDANLQIAHFSEDAGLVGAATYAALKYKTSQK